MKRSKLLNIEYEDFKYQKAEEANPEAQLLSKEREALFKEVAFSMKDEFGFHYDYLSGILFSGKSFRQISEDTGLPVSTIQKRIESSLSSVKTRIETTKKAS